MNLSAKDQGGDHECSPIMVLENATGALKIFFVLSLAS